MVEPLACTETDGAVLSCALGWAGGAEPTLSEKEKVTVLIFLINCFQSLEEAMIRQVLLTISQALAAYSRSLAC